MHNDLIFDLGFHNGTDTAFYLSKGFKVVAIEANPELINDGLIRFKNEIDTGKLILLNNAIADKPGDSINFYIHPTKTEWSSCIQTKAESDGSQARLASVITTTLLQLCDEFGTPTYVKTDIEGHDITVAQQLFLLKDKPSYVSFETSKQDYAGIFSWLYVSGYKSFQLQNQLNNPPFSSGKFGQDLDLNKWKSFDETLVNYIKYKELKAIDNIELACGWLDVHARFSR